MSIITVINNTPEHISTFVTKSTADNGTDTWCQLAPSGGHDRWARGDGWELVAFKNADDTTHAGVYVPVNFIVTFKSLENITVT